MLKMVHTVVSPLYFVILHTATLCLQVNIIFFGEDWVKEIIQKMINDP